MFALLVASVARINLIAWAAPLLLAQHVGGGAWGIGSIVLTVIVVAGVIAIMFVALRAMKIQVPGWVLNMAWICVVVFVAILAVKFILSLWGL